MGADRFLLEIRTLARLQHPHILALLDSGATDEAPPRPYYVMPYPRPRGDRATVLVGGD